MLSFLSVEEGKLFIKKSSFREFNLVFFRYKKITFLKGNLCISQSFYTFLFFGAKRKLQNALRFEMDFVLNFSMCSADFTRVNGSTIQIVSLANYLKGLTFWILNTNFQETASLSIVLSFFIHKISSRPVTTTSKLKWFSPYTHHFCEDVGEFYTIFTFRFSCGHFSIRS